MALDRINWDKATPQRTSPEGGVAPSGSGSSLPAGAVCAAIDLGTNNCRLLIARTTPKGFRIVDSYSRIVRLGEGLASEGIISTDATARALKALAVCQRKIARLGAKAVRAVATEACRRAANRDAFVQTVAQETGLALDIISPEEEARLAVLGCQSLLDPRFPYGLVFDIGGGSTEVVFLARRAGGRIEILDFASLPAGVITLSEAHGLPSADPTRYRHTREQVRMLMAAVEERVGFAEQARRGCVQLIGTSGTVTTLASTFLKLPRYDRRRVDGTWFASSALTELARKVALMPQDRRARLPSIGPDRARYVVAGCAVLEALLTVWPADRLRVADRGLREGVLRTLIGQDDMVIWKQTS